MLLLKVFFRKEPEHEGAVFEFCWSSMTMKSTFQAVRVACPVAFER